MATKAVQVLAADAPFVTEDLSALPPSLVEMYNGKGHNLLLSYNSPQNYAMLATRQCYVVTLDDLPADRRPELVRELVRMGFSVRRDDNTIHKGDCALFSQPEVARVHFSAEDHQTWMNQGYASDMQAEALREETARQLPPGFGKLVGAKTEGALRGHYGRPPSPPK